MPVTITVGLDGTGHSVAAADWAAHEAVRRGAALRLVYAWAWRAGDTSYVGDREAEERMVRAVLGDAESRVTAAHPSLDVSAELVVGDPVPTLVDEAARARMLVLGSRGYGTLAGYLIGSVSLHVLRRTTRPVVMVRETHPDAPAPRPSGDVVVGVQDAETAGGPVLDFAFGAAAERGVPLRAVYAWEVPPVLMWSPGSMWVAEQQGGLEPVHRRILADALKPWREKYPQVEVVEQVGAGPASEVLLSRTEGAQLLVVGRRTHEPGVRRLGSVTHAALHHAPCAVAVVPHA
ncbi:MULTISPECIES: universal stress protein [unclassified Streptomyces]|uniref:universal stress protein n=1 Tax=unclassified Streptomyces TaxID=2593676 RepID=UPI0001C1BB23|nr:MULTISPECIES: universal stress protein [unclassified Streptomyces]AEN13609.1 UspA domain protein [Streptomyces sp. SirexAA-E]MYR64648.1 universal stress protein [Streptomyces sp. SID4939]MYT66941.1 universal stress protein [Streptomyces sp. SID8357]MYT84585.1 universal stress protein [Streptomyces sp. SID8360]MYW41063.1 universal stress protein [Streptomyces sp. SID1]